jgi:hypothetical protein
LSIIVEMPIICMDNEKVLNKCPPPTLRQLLKDQKYQEMQEKEKFVKR